MCCWVCKVTKFLLQAKFFLKILQKSFKNPSPLRSPLPSRGGLKLILPAVPKGGSIHGDAEMKMFINRLLCNVFHNSSYLAGSSDD
jgi:hypothetical protein